MTGMESKIVGRSIKETNELVKQAVKLGKAFIDFRVMPHPEDDSFKERKKEGKEIVADLYLIPETDELFDKPVTELDKEQKKLFQHLNDSLEKPDPSYKQKSFFDRVRDSLG